MSRGKRVKRARTDPPRQGGAEQPSPSGQIRRPTASLETLPALVLLLALVASLTLGLIWNEDLWWYLSTGEVVLDQGGIPDHDLLLYTSTEETFWPSHSWLFSVTLALILRLVGLSGVVIFGALLAGAIITLIFCSARVDRFGLVNALLTALVIVAAGGRLALKAELVTWLLVVVFFYLLDRDAPFTWRTLLILCGLEWAWANLHAGYPLGSAMVFAYSVGGWLEGWWKRRKGRAAASTDQPDAYKPPPLWAAPVVLLASLLTPLAAERLHMLGIVSTITSSHLTGFELSQTVNELQPTFKAADSTYALFYVLAVAVGTITLYAGRSLPRSLSRLCFLAGLALLGYTAIRHVTGAVIAAVLVTLTTLGELRSLPRVRRRRASGRQLYYAASAAVVLLLLSGTAGLWLLCSDFEAGQSADDFFTISPLATCPGAATYILEQNLPGPIFNDMSLGGYLTYRLYPRHQLFIDNRILSNRQMREYMEMSLSRDRWLEAEKKHGFRTAVLTNLTVPSFVPLRSFLAADRRWRLVYADPLASVFVRTEASSATQVFNEPRKAPFLVPEDGFGSWLRKAAGLFFRTSPDPLLGQYLSALGNLQRYELIDRLATEALEMRPEDPAIYRARGSARMVRRRLQEGLSDIREAVHYGPDDPANRFTYALALRDSGDPRQALSEIEKALQLDPGNDRFETLRRQLAARVR